jgi:hypothetical protein
MPAFRIGAPLATPTARRSSLRLATASALVSTAPVTPAGYTYSARA